MSKVQRTRRTFRDIYVAEMRRNARLLWEKAVIANRTAKICASPDALYLHKAQLLSTLRRMGLLYFTDAYMAERGILLCAAFKGGGKMHVAFRHLDQDVQESIGSLVTRLLNLTLGRTA